jgi:hypothetical protein
MSITMIIILLIASGLGAMIYKEEGGAT